MPRTKERTTPPARRKFDPDAPRKGDRRRDLLLDSAEQLLAENSAEQLTLDDVATKAGLSRSGVYFYFDSKWALLDALIDLRADGMVERALENADTATVPELVRQFVEASLWTWRNHGAVFAAAVERASHGGEATAAWQAVMDRCIDAIVATVESEGRNSTALHPVGDIRTAATLAGWMTERNFYMLFAREHTAEEERHLADALHEAGMRLLDAPMG